MADPVPCNGRKICLRLLAPACLRMFNVKISNVLLKIFSVTWNYRNVANCLAMFIRIQSAPYPYCNGNDTLQYPTGIGRYTETKLNSSLGQVCQMMHSAVQYGTGILLRSILIPTFKLR
jgi:hypothetical protein